MPLQKRNLRGMMHLSSHSISAIRRSRERVASAKNTNWKCMSMAKADNTPKSAFFVIADISGYTKFMSETEITHAKGILGELFGAIVPVIRAPLSISGLQGDAVFSFAFESDVMTKHFIMDFAEQIYCTFAKLKEKMLMNTSCPCSACNNARDLELKFVVHHGDCIVLETAGRQERAGQDVITAFRLLKNSANERTGLNASMLISCDALRKMDMKEFFSEDEFHTENIEHIGALEYVVRDMKQALERRRNSDPIIVSPKDDLLVDEWVTTIPVSPSAAFTMCTRPDMRARWLGADAVDLSGVNKGKVEPGTEYQCHHGDQIFPFEIVDWRPGEYATGCYNLPGGNKVYETNEFVSMGEGTMVKVRFTKAKTDKLFGKLMSGMINKKLLGFLVPEKETRLNRLHEISQEWLAEDGGLAADQAPDLDDVAKAGAIA